MINRLNTLFLLLFVSLMAFGQSAGTIASKDAMLYESSRHLYEKGDTLTIISKDLEWPKGLDGSLLPELQHYLTSFFFNQPSESYDTGWKQFESSLGKEVRTIKDDAGAERRFYDMGLRMSLVGARQIHFLFLPAWRSVMQQVSLRQSILILPLTLSIRKS